MPRNNIIKNEDMRGVKIKRLIIIELFVLVGLFHVQMNS